MARQNELIAAQDFQFAEDDVEELWCVRKLLLPDPEEDGYDSEPVAVVFNDAYGNEDTYACLFAAAPEMEAALKAAQTELRRFGKKVNGAVLDEIHAALKKAKGE